MLFVERSRQYNELKDELTSEISRLIIHPSINLFVLWVLNDAIKKRKQKLYFLARDGYFMHRIAEFYCTLWNLQIECEYIYCSRFSLRLASYYLDMDSALDHICRGGIDVNLKKIMGRTGLSKQEIAVVLKYIKLPYEYTEPIPYKQLKQVKKGLKDCAYFIECVKKHSKKKYSIMQAYLSQVGLMDDGTAAFVDSGWTGSIQETLNLVLKASGKKEEVDGYYWGLYEIPSGSKREMYHSFYFTPEKGYKRKIFFSNCLFEVLVSAPSGMTEGYIEKDGRIIPKCGKISIYNREIIRIEQENLDAYLVQIKRRMKNIDFSNIDFEKEKRVISKNLTRLMSCPTIKEAFVLGRMKFSDDIVDDNAVCLARKMNEIELIQNHLMEKILRSYGISKKSCCESAWYEGSIVRSHWRWIHWANYIIYKSLLYIKKEFYGAYRYVRTK